MFFHHTSLGTSPRAIEPADAASLLAQGSVLVDIRSPIEFARGHVRGAVSIPFADPQFCVRAEQILPHGATLILMDDDIPDTLHDDIPEIEQAAYQTYTLYTGDDGSITGTAFTNDNNDWGTPNESASWEVRYRDRADMEKQTGKTHVGVSGVRVEVILDGVRV